MRTRPRCTAPRSTPWPGRGPGAFANVRFGWLESRVPRLRADPAGDDRRATGSWSSSTASSRTPATRCSTPPTSRSASPASRRFRSGAGARSPARYDGVWTDTTYYDATKGVGLPNIDDIQSLPDDTIAQPPFWLHNLRLAYRPPGGRIEIAGWVRNLTNQSYKTFAFDAQHLQRHQHLLRRRSAHLRRHPDRHLLKRRSRDRARGARVRGACSRARAAG